MSGKDIEQKKDKKLAKAMKTEMDARVAELTEQLKQKLAQLQQCQQLANQFQTEAIELQGAIKYLQNTGEVKEGSKDMD